MELYSLDKNINLMGIVENYSSLRWLTEYNGLGEFQLVANVTDDNIKLLVQDSLLWKNDGDTAGIIEMVEIKKDKMEVRGRLTNRLLLDRIVLNQINMTNIETGIRKAITDNAILSRNIPNLILGTINNFTDTQISQFRFDYLFDVVNKYKSKFGFKITLDIPNKKHIFNLYKGKDLSGNIIFSEEYENIVESVINEDNSKYKNFAIIGGRGEGVNRKIAFVDLLPGQFATRREMWVDAKDIEDKKRLDDGTEVAYTDDEMTNMLRQRGYEKLSEQVELNSFNSVIVANGNYIYKQDYNIGDLVTCKSSKYNIQLKVRITAIQEIYDNSGYKILATLGDI